VNINPTIASGIGTDSKGNPFVVAARTLAAFKAAGVPVLGRVMDEQSVNRSRYDGLNFSYRQRMTKYFSVNANYTLSRAMGWSVESGGTMDLVFPELPAYPLTWILRVDNRQRERHHVSLTRIVKVRVSRWHRSLPMVRTSLT